MTQVGHLSPMPRRERADTVVAMHLHPEIRQALVNERHRDAMRDAAHRHLVREARATGVRRGRPMAEITIRLARADDASALWALAVLDSARPLDGAVLTARVDGDLIAACSLADGRTISDPFRRTEMVRRLLELRREQLLAPALERRTRRRTVLAALGFDG